MGKRLLASCGVKFMLAVLYRRLDWRIGVFGSAAGKCDVPKEELCVGEVLIESERLKHS